MYDAYQTMTSSLTESGVLTVTFNRPASLNSMDKHFHRELSTIFADIGHDPAVRAVVLTGGGRAFSSGGDLAWIQNEVRADPEPSYYEARKIVQDLIDLPQPIVAAVNGPAAGFGLTMALLCDVSIVSIDAHLSDPHVAVGLVAGDGGAMTWPLLVGMARAKRHLMTGDPIDAATAAEWGLVTETCDTADVLDRALAVAERFTTLPQAAVEGTKRTLNALLKTFATITLDLGLAAERVSAVSTEHYSIIDGLVEARNNRRSGGQA